ncbi:MAG: Dps family protein [Planctomycetota bacterium]|nr:Dps family protein [Planctomycetota bacterium]
MTATATRPITDQLNVLLADYQVWYQKLRNYHWNVKGPLFFGLHEKFEELYLDAAVKADELAERVLALGTKPLSTLREALDHARLAEDDGSPSAETMVQNLVSDIGTLNQALRATAKAAADSGDDATMNLLDPMADEQEKTAWMLRAFLG